MVASEYGAVLVVDDGSVDKTGEVAAATGATVVRLEENRGYDNALQAGFESASGLGVDAIVTFDADGEHRPEALRQVIQALRSDKVDMVIGVRDRIPRFSEVLFNMYTRFRFNVPDIVCGLKGYRLSLYQRHGCFDNDRSIGTQLALWGLRNKVPYSLVAVKTGKRADSPRLGAFLRGNYVILRAFFRAVFRDIRNSARVTGKP